MLDDERCILCSRCIRFCDEIIGENVLGFINHGSYSTLTCYPGKELTSNYSLNTVDLCPVGALTSTDFRFQMRVWFLKQTSSICTESSTGVNTIVWSREGKIYRITPRQNDAVNDCWMPDSGRELYKIVEAQNRLHYPAIAGNKVNLDLALDRVMELFSISADIAYVTNGHASLEEHFALKRLVEAVPGEVHLRSHLGRTDERLISEDRTPNIRGAWVSGLTNKVATADLSDLKTQIEHGNIKTLIVINEDIIAAGIEESSLKHLNIIYLGTHANATSAKAHVIIPTLTVFEKTGSFINVQYRLQKFHQAIPGPVGTMPDIIILDRLHALITKSERPAWSLSDLWNLMADQCTELQDHSFEKIPAQGILLNASRFQHFVMPETKLLHYSSL
jgi:NADH-quinone oxidoreductase subunit G